MEAFSPLRFTSNATIRLQRGPCGPVAQWLEQGTHNPLVGGSNPSRPTILVFNVLQTNQSAAGAMHDTPFALVGVLLLRLPEKQGLYLLPNKGQRVL